VTAAESATTSDVVDDARTKGRAISAPVLGVLRRRNPVAHHASIGTASTKFAASIARYSERVSNPMEFGFPNSLRCRAPCIGLARDSSRANGERERQAPISTRRTAPNVPSLVPR